MTNFYAGTQPLTGNFQPMNYNPSWSEVGKAAAISAAPIVIQGLSAGIMSLFSKYNVGTTEPSLEEKMAQMQNTIDVLTVEKSQLLQLIQAQEAKIQELEAKQMTNGAVSPPEPSNTNLPQ